jgi:hypothetical protein
MHAYGDEDWARATGHRALKDLQYEDAYSALRASKWVIGRAERAEIDLAMSVTRTRGHLVTSRLLTEAKTRSTDAR